MSPDFQARPASRIRRTALRAATASACRAGYPPPPWHRNPIPLKTAHAGRNSRRRSRHSSATSATGCCRAKMPVSRSFRVLPRKLGTVELRGGTRYSRAAACLSDMSFRPGRGGALDYSAWSLFDPWPCVHEGVAVELGGVDSEFTSCLN